MSGSGEGDVTGKGLAQALPEVREVQQDAVGRLTCRGGKFELCGRNIFKA